jgi:hypothetical protein
MAINIGYIEGTCNDGDVVVRIYYDATAPHSTPAEVDAQPLINGPRGFCLDVTNTSGGKAVVSISGGAGGVRNVTINKGDPVTSGAGRSRTAAQVASQLGLTTRGSVGEFQLQCG